MIVSVVGAAPAGAAKFGRVHVGAYRIRPPYGRGAGKRAGAHCEKAMQALRDHFIHYEKAAQVLRDRSTHCDDAVQVLRDRSTHCDDAVQVLHGHFTHCGDAAQVLHSRFTHCDDAVQVLHSRFTHCGDAAQVLHGRFAHCDGPRNGAYAFAPLPGYTPFMYPAKFAGVRRRPGKLRCPRRGRP